jgi:hypothetical protein
MLVTCLRLFALADLPDVVVLLLLFWPKPPKVEDCWVLLLFWPKPPNPPNDIVNS